MCLLCIVARADLSIPEGPFYNKLDDGNSRDIARGFQVYEKVHEITLYIRYKVLFL